MAISTYLELVSAVTAYTAQDGNAEVTDQIPTFISLGEAEVYRRLRHERMISSSSIDYANPPYLVPADFLEAEAVWVGYETMAYVPAEVILSKAASTDLPTRWSLLGTEIIFDGTPDTTAALSYYAKPAELSSSLNVIFTQNPDIFLYAALAEAMIFMRDEERQQIWHDLMVKKIQSLMSSAWSAKVPRGQALAALVKRSTV